MLGNPFKPKWQHRKAEVRLNALRELAVDDPALVELARHDIEAEVRRAAIQRIEDLSLLFAIYREDADSEVREGAGRRLVRRFAEGAGLASEMLSAWLAQASDEALAEQLARLGAEPAVRLAALAHVQRQALLGDIAVADAAAEVRLAAFERLERLPTLERVAKEARGRDKRIARLARERVEALRLEAERPARQLGVCEALEQINENGGLDLVGYRRLAGEWASLLPAADEVAGRYAQACRCFEGLNEAHRKQQLAVARQRELCERAEALRERVSAREGTLGELETACAELAADWQAQADGSEEVNPGLAQRLGEARTACAEGLRAWDAERRRHERLQKLQTEVEILAAAEVVEEKALHALQGRWQVALDGRWDETEQRMNAIFVAACQRIRERQAASAAERRAIEGELNELLGRLATALEQGQLQQAIAVNDRLRSRQERLKALGGSLSSSAARRLGKLISQLGELRDWRRYGTDQSRQELLKQMQALIDLPPPLSKLAGRIKKLQEAWRALDRKDGLAPEALWNTFQELGKTAYTPCQAQLQAREQELERHSAERQAFLDALEQTLAETDWDNPQWEQLDERLRKARRQWAKLGGVDPQRWNALNARFKAIAEAYDHRLSDQRERDKVRREALIAMVEKLADEPELGRAIAQTREAQERWRPSVLASPRVEQALWKRFRAACDAVFARQKAEEAGRRAEQGRLASEREALCRQLEVLAGDGQGGWEHARTEVEQLRGLWQEVPPLQGRQQQALERRFAKALTRFDKGLEADRRSRRNAEFEALVERSRLCARLERLAVKGDSEELASARESWEVVSPLNQPEWQAVLNARAENAFAGTCSGAEENTRRLGELCLEMEILAGLPSPPELAEERMALQVKMLAEAMTGSLTEVERRSAVRERLVNSYLTGPVGMDQYELLLNRINDISARTGVFFDG